MHYNGLKQVLWIVSYIFYLIETCGHIRQGEDDCEMKMPRSFVFRTGRKDCVPEGDQKRAFLTSRQEIHPDSHGNGKQTVDFYRENFGLSAREGIALTGGKYSRHHKNKTIYYICMYWTNLWQPTVHVQQNIFENFFL